MMKLNPIKQTLLSHFTDRGIEVQKVYVTYPCDSYDTGKNFNHVFMNLQLIFLATSLNYNIKKRREIEGHPGLQESDIQLLILALAG